MAEKLEAMNPELQRLHSHEGGWKVQKIAEATKRQLARLRLLTWAVDPSPDFLDGGLAGACPGSEDREAEFRFRDVLVLFFVPTRSTEGCA